MEFSDIEMSGFHHVPLWENDDDKFPTDSSSRHTITADEFESLTFFDDIPSTIKAKSTNRKDSDSSTHSFEEICYSQNLEDWIVQLKQRKILALSQLGRLCAKVKEVLSEESNLVSVSSPVTICGDIHGQFYDLQELFRIAGEPPDVNYLFLGDYVDRGRFSVVVVSLLLALKIRFPKRITLLRGNHEARQTTQVYGFYDECYALYGDARAWTLFMSAFDYLPLCALIDNNHLCMHGGLSPSIGTVDQIRTLLRFDETPHDGPICDILWSDPDDRPDSFGFQNSARGAGCIWGKDVSAYFTKANGIETITRAHQLVDEGIKWCHDDKVITVFSAPNYCYRSGNLAGYIMVNGSSSQSFAFEAAPRKDSHYPSPTFQALKSYFF